MLDADAYCCCRKRQCRCRRCCRNCSKDRRPRTRAGEAVHPGSGATVPVFTSAGTVVHAPGPEGRPPRLWNNSPLLSHALLRALLPLLPLLLLCNKMAQMLAWPLRPLRKHVPAQPLPESCHVFVMLSTPLSLPYLSSLSSLSSPSSLSTSLSQA